MEFSVLQQKLNDKVSSMLEIILTTSFLVMLLVTQLAAYEVGSFENEEKN